MLKLCSWLLLCYVSFLASAAYTASDPWHGKQSIQLNLINRPHLFTCWHRYLIQLFDSGWDQDQFILWRCSYVTSGVLWKGYAKNVDYVENHLEHGTGCNVWRLPWVCLQWCPSLKCLGWLLFKQQDSELLYLLSFFFLFFFKDVNLLTLILQCIKLNEAHC